MWFPPSLVAGYLHYCVCLIVWVLTVTTDGTKAKRADTIGCFLCNSFNGSDPACDDPFHPATITYSAHCKQGMQGRVGEFPASYCIKMAGISMSRGVRVTVRTCLLESMHHQCGIFSFEQELYEGCITTCEEDGCNTSANAQHGSIVLLILTSLSTILMDT